jgi:hypothetical protein
MGLESEGLTFFEALDRDEEYAGFWWSAMGMAEYGFGSFPWAKLWEDVSRKEDGRERVFVVDVGGGHGKRLMGIIRELGEVKDKEPNLKPMMVLEDLGGVIGGETPVNIEGVKNVVYDFFQQRAEQPVKGETSSSSVREHAKPASQVPTSTICATFCTTTMTRRLVKSSSRLLTP